MLVHRQQFAHPTQPSRVRLNVYEYVPAEEPAVTGMGPRRRGYLLTEDRVATTTVVATLGFFEDREQALAAAAERARELERQRFRPLAPAA